MSAHPRHDDSDLLAAVLGEVSRSRRYRSVDATLVERLVREEREPGHFRAREVADRVKRRLHQIFGAYVPNPPPYERLHALLADGQAGGAEALRARLRQVMSWHVSTQERVDQLGAFYGHIRERVGAVARVLDLGSGLNPLAIPWMGLAPDTHYQACDIDSQLVAFLADWIPRLGVSGGASVCDLASSNLNDYADLALMLKLVPCLDQQATGRGEQLIERINARFVAVSFPTRTLSGRNVGMFQTYSQRFQAMADRHQWALEQFEVGHELVYLVAKQTSSTS